MQSDNQTIEQPQPSLDSSAGGKNSTAGIFAAAILVVIIVAIGAYSAFFAGKIATDSLVRQTSGSSVYLRPEHWTASPDVFGDGVSSYGDWSEGSNKMGSATVVFREAAQLPGMAHASDEAVERLRQELLTSSDQNSSLENAGSSACVSLTNSKPEIDTKKNDTVTGLAVLTSTCQRQDGQKASSRIRMAIGSDGVLRVISITAREDSWKKNEAVFQMMLDSVEQTVKINS